MDEDWEKEMLRNSEGKNLQSSYLEDHPIIAMDEDWKKEMLRNSKGKNLQSSYLEDHLIIAMDEDLKKEMLRNSKGKNLQSSYLEDHPIISKFCWDMKAYQLKWRARGCNRRKDILYLLWSYPMKRESDQADLFLLRDKFIKLNRMIKGLDSTMEKNATNLGQLVEDIHAVMEDVEFCLAKHDSDIKLYDASLRQHCNSEPQHDRQEVEVHIIGSAVRQIFHFFEGGQLKVIGISGYRPVMVREALKDQSVKRGMFNLVISVRVQEDYGICEVQNSIAQEIHRITGTDISLPIDEALKPYNFLLFLDCRNQIIDLHDLKIPEHGSVVLASRLGYVYNIMLVDHEIRMEDHQLPWSLFWKNVANFPSLKIEPIASQLVELCHSHLLAFILLTRALKSVTDVRVWQHALGELSSSSFSPLMKGRSHEVMVVVLKLVWERKGIVTRHCIKHLCTSVTKDIKLEKTSLVSCWIENDLIETETEGNHVLKDLIKSFLLEKVSKGYVRMREETRDVLLKQFIPHLHPLYLKQEGLGLSEAPEVAEWDAKEIYLNNNHLSELPEKPNCPSLVTLLLQGNYDLMEIPSSFFECMPMLQVLDLSHASIKSLPASISGLVSLQELFLRGCELLMELPPEIGALSKLQVLDLEGTEIMYLPKEISGLTKLECLEVSLYGYGKSYREDKQICKRIPAGSLASLCMLKALSIDVNPDDDEWVADVKDVTDELLKLRSLMTLKLYLPEVGQLKGITSVRNFKFTVGHHKQCIIPCLPHGVEEEFEKQENCLKYINGKYIPIEIQNTLKCTCAFFLERHWTVKKLSEFGNENLVELKFCLLAECNELQTIIDGEEICTEGYQMCESGVDKKLVFNSLEYLGIHCMMNLRSIWEGPIGKDCLSKLKYMALHSCPNLTSIFTASLLGNLDNLEELIIEDCPQINSLVSQESSCFEPKPFLPSLKKTSLLDLPELVSISSGLLFAPKLERIIVYACPMLESLSPMELSSNDLKVIKGEIEWWNSLKWLESDWSSRQKDYMANVFVELRRDASLMDQLAKSGNSM